MPPRQQLQNAAFKRLLIPEYDLFPLWKKGGLSLECIRKLRWGPVIMSYQARHDTHLTLMEYLVLRKDDSESDFHQNSLKFLSFSSEFLNNFIISEINIVC